MKHLSIIIPMYKVESFVEKCLRSLENQDIPRDEYEIICINDGSPDKSREVVVLLQKEYENIILIDQENQGVSRARNNGIDKSVGRYILLIDPDDYVDANCFGRILKKADMESAQVIFLGFTFLYEDGSIRNRVFSEQHVSKVYPGIEAYFLARGDGRIDPDRMVAILFNTDFIKHNNLRYLSDVPYLEDGEFIARILCLAERCIFDGNSFYQRTTRAGSATNSNLVHSEKASKGFLLAATNLKMFQQQQSLTENQKAFLNQSIIQFVILFISSGLKPFSFKRIKHKKRKLVESGFSKLKLNSASETYKHLGYFYNRSIYLLFIFQCIKRVVDYLHLRINRIKTI